MSALGMVVIVGLLGGLAVGLQQPQINLLGERLGTTESIFIVQFGGAIAAGLIMLARRGGNLNQWHTIPWYALGCGVLGLAVVGAVVYVVPRQGAGLSSLLIVAGQLVASVIIDHYGLFDTVARRLDPSRVAGVVLMFVAVWLIAR